LTDLLNQSQKNSLATVLRLFEADLRQIEYWLDSPPSEGILYRQELPLIASQRAEARHQINAAKDEIAFLAKKLNLEPEVENLAGLIRGQMSVAWANLVDSQAKKLKRYGKVQAETAQEIDHPIHHLAQIALELASLFENHSSTPASPGAENLNKK
jgi:hypothetical protein